MKKVKGFIVSLEDSVSEEYAETIKKCLGLIVGVFNIELISEKFFEDHIVEMNVKSGIRRKMIDFIKENL